MTHDPRAALLAAALAAAERGWPVFPLRPGDKRPAGHAEERCPRTGRCAGGHLTPEQRATTDPALIEACWGKRPYNIGLATGPAGLVVVDLDVAKGNEMPTEPGITSGADVLAALCEQHQQRYPCDTLTVQTPSGGTHLYFTAPPGARLRNSAGKLGRFIDTRAWGGYVVAPGSTVTGRSYRVAHDAPMVPLPAWLATLLNPTPPTPTPAVGAVRRGAGSGAVRDLTAYGDKVLASEVDNVKRAPERQRNVTLFNAARAVGRLVAQGVIDYQVAFEALHGVGESRGLPARECGKTIRSAFTWTAAHSGRAA